MSFSKRGFILSLSSLVDLALVIIVSISFIHAAGFFSNEEQIKNYYVARDVSQAINALQASNNNIQYAYPPSFSGRDVVIQGNVVRVQLNASETQKEFSSAEAHFIRADKYIFPAQIVLDASDFSMNKIGNKIIFKNGKLTAEEEEKLLNEYSINTKKKNDMKIKLVGIGETLDQQKIIKGLTTEINILLKENNFVLDESNPNLILEITFKDQEFNTVSYSTEDKILTKGLAENINKILRTQLTFLSRTYENSETESTTIPKITIALSTRKTNMDQLEENEQQYKQTQHYFAKRVVLAFSNYFQE